MNIILLLTVLSASVLPVGPALPGGWLNFLLQPASPLLSADRAINTTPSDETVIPPADSLLIDATWVPCGDSTESLYISQDGNAVYAWSTSGVAFRLGDSMLKELKDEIGRTKSTVDTAALDSCTTVGIVLAGPRYLLMNTTRPPDQLKGLANELAILRKYARRKIERDIDRTLDYIEARPDTGIASQPELDPETLRRAIYNSPVASSWRCRGEVMVTAQIDAQGNVRRAFVNDVPLRGKCAAVMIMTALRAVTLSTFEPARKTAGNAGAAWVNIAVKM